MFIATNRFKVLPSAAHDFEQRWLSREVYLHTLPGFQRFQLLRGPATDDYVLYVSNIEWASRGAFEAWRTSEAFQKAHAPDRTNAHIGMHVAPPAFEGFEVIQALNEQGQTLLKA
ncbi:antibiotic biosynthesis monooxygenase family protein [Zymobacter palmae]|uniref:Hypothetical cytosolic protein n=1 Tax=Zymobacter palmae TaxID=33074 RepID=A0A348HFR5_9GAMM|nr:antibiotic biosynthesis monooxygenase [Zymobacter palmae]BBG30467.1 hypothetical cytosolic protein [Zymobacter palmae]